MKIVMKFGGAALSTADDIRFRVELIRRYSMENDIIVVSSALKGVTDSLLNLIHHAVKGRERDFSRELEIVRDKHIKISKELGLDGEVERKIEEYLDDLEKIIYSIYYLRETTPRAKDYVLSFGERLSTLILSEEMRKRGLDTVYLTGGEAGIVTDSRFGNANPELKLIDRIVKINLLPLLDDGNIPVVTGFIGVDEKGNITTLGRGGSDLTASLIAYALDADEVWFWKDVPGIMTADPKIVSDAKKISKLSYKEAAELSALGAEVLHPRAVMPLSLKKISVRIKGYLNQDDKGTLIGKDSGKLDEIAKAIALTKDVALINIYSTFMVGVPGISGRIFSVLGEYDVNILMISQNVSEANLSILVKKKDLKKGLKAIEKAREEIKYIEEISYEKDVAAVSVIGEGMRGTPGIAAKVFQAVAEKGINIKMIAQGSSEINISFVVELRDGEEAVRAVHKRFKLGNLKN